MYTVSDPITVKDVINRVDSLYPNVHPFSLKASWVYELDRRMYNDIFSRFESPPEMPSVSYDRDTDAVLLADRDFICLYAQHILVQSDLASGDAESYANDSVLFNKFYKIFMEYINRTHKARRTEISLY